MLKKESSIDTLVYIILCIVTLGAVWATRIIISQAIRSAIKD